jgi:PII-like signaling protein
MLLIFVDETDTWGEMPLYEAIVRKLAHAEVAGATVQAGIMGFGSHHKVHHKRLFGISDDRPVTIAAVDTAAAIERGLAEVRPIVAEGLIVTLDVEVVS